MRRKDREITDNNEIDKIINECNCVRLGLNDDGKVYIVPLNFGFEHDDDKRRFYFHSAKEGRKIDLLKKTKSAGFEMDTGFSIMEGKTACDYSAKYKSVIGEGNVSFVEDLPQKRECLLQLMKKNTGKSSWLIPDAMLNAVCVFFLEVTEISCKERK